MLSEWFQHVSARRKKKPRKGAITEAVLLAIHWTLATRHRHSRVVVTVVVRNVWISRFPVSAWGFLLGGSSMPFNALIWGFCIDPLAYHPNLYLTLGPHHGHHHHCHAPVRRDVTWPTLKNHRQEFQYFEWLSWTIELHFRIFLPHKLSWHQLKICHDWFLTFKVWELQPWLRRQPIPKHSRCLCEKPL